MKIPLSELPQKITAGRLGKRFAILIVIFSSVFTLFSTSFQLALDYRADINRIEQQFLNIKTSYLQAITLSVWSLDDSQIETQLLGLSQLPDIEYVAVVVDNQIHWSQGEAQSKANRQITFPLDYKAPGIPHQNIGELEIIASIDNVYNRLLNKAGVILVSNGIKTFLVSGFILILIWLLITRHLQIISDYLRRLDSSHLQQPLALQTRRNPRKANEIDNVVIAINEMRAGLLHSYQALNEKEKHLQQLVDERDQLLEREREHKELLEERVLERTQQLEDSMEELKSAQDLLVETEKMAALGNMVAGVAHEINTPIGVCRTASSYQGENSRLIRDKLNAGTLTQSDLSAFLDGVDESSTLFESNIVKASKLISSFKLIATDQSYDTLQTFNIKDYIDSSIQTIYPQYKHRKVVFEIDVKEDINVTGYPGALHQVLSNLIHNSTLHGFDKGTGGTIRISAYKEQDMLRLEYRDSGRGLSEEERKKLFEPFFTTKRGKGGSGLGMSIVFNIVSRQLKGQLQLPEDQSAGFHLTLCLPLTLSQEER